MSIRVTRLSNGLRVATHQMPHLGTVALGVWVASGARHESAREHGISHLLEHMAFKGTARRSAQDIAEEIEQVGGDLNAATSLDTTYYYARVLRDDVAIALDILADIIQNPRYSEDELERERDVILQEIAGTKDSPDDTVYDLAQDAAYTDQPLGRPILGTPASVTSFTTGDLRTFLKARYRAGSMVLSAAGNVDHDALVRHAEAFFKDLGAGQPTTAESAHYVGGARASEKPFEQAHVVMGFEGMAYKDPAFYAAQVFSGLFGGGMSSRLFQEVREKRGLCYSIYSSAWGLGGHGHARCPRGDRTGHDRRAGPGHRRRVPARGRHAADREGGAALEGPAQDRTDDESRKLGRARRTDGAPAAGPRPAADDRGTDRACRKRNACSRA